MQQSGIVRHREIASRERQNCVAKIIAGEIADVGWVCGGNGGGNVLFSWPADDPYRVAVCGQPPCQRSVIVRWPALRRTDGTRCERHRPPSSVVQVVTPAPIVHLPGWHDE